jgi:FRG domain-containing protein
MQSITPQLTEELVKHIRSQDIWRAPAFEIGNYRALVEHVARLSYTNRNQLVFFRGQGNDYQNKAGGSTLYPAIYRSDNLLHAELEVRFRRLESASRILVELFGKHKIEGARDVSRKKYVQWSILQHYEIVPTPLLDITHSLRVACSFAQLAGTAPTCYVYVMGFPYPTNRISINSEEDLVNIRLLSICPPDALRPYFQEGFMAGTPDVTSNFETKTELDFRNRLIAKFAIPRAKSFWNAGFEGTPRTALYPPEDRVHELCQEINTQISHEGAASGDVGQLLVEWAKLEEQLLPRARRLTQKNVSVREAIRALVEPGLINHESARGLEEVRRIRNTAAHTPGKVNQAEVQLALYQLRELERRIQAKLT